MNAGRALDKVRSAGDNTDEVDTELGRRGFVMLGQEKERSMGENMGDIIRRALKGEDECPLCNLHEAELDAVKKAADEELPAEEPKKEDAPIDAPKPEQKGWDAASYKSAWSRLSSPGGKLRNCMRAMGGKVSDPARYCMWLWTQAGKPARD